jgi:hypothetical protein
MGRCESLGTPGCVPYPPRLPASGSSLSFPAAAIGVCRTIDPSGTRLSKGLLVHGPGGRTVIHTIIRRARKMSNQAKIVSL